MLTTSASRRGSTSHQSPSLEHLETRLLVLQQQRERAGVGVMIHAEMAAARQSVGRSGVGHGG